MLTVTIWLSFAFTLGLVMRHVGLPPLVGFLAAGFALHGLGYTSNPLLEEVAHVGVLLLLFSVGLKLRLKSLFRLEVLAGALSHMLVIGGFYFLVLIQISHVSQHAAVIIALALSFSSTVIAAKVLEGKKQLRAFHGRVAIGILIVQDIVAVAILSVSANQTPSPWAFLLLGLVLAKPLIHKLLDWTSHDELLILFGLMIAIVIGGNSFAQFGLSAELGALLLGIMLASHKRATELSSSIWSLKEILLVGFFLQIGLAGHPTLQLLGYALILLLVIPIKGILFFFILLLFRLRARSSFLTGLSLATYSEFGLILANLGNKNGWMDSEWLVIFALAVALSFTLSAPLNHYANRLYSWMEPFLIRFESKKYHPDDEPLAIGNSRIIIMGMGRVGTGAYDFLTQRSQRIIGLDSDPGKIEAHRKQGRRVLYADAEDPALWHNLNLAGVTAILLAMPDAKAKASAAKQIRLAGFTGLISATATFSEELDSIINAGADLAYNYYDEVGVGFAEHVWQALTSELQAGSVTDNT